MIEKIKKVGREFLRDEGDFLVVLAALGVRDFITTLRTPELDGDLVAQEPEPRYRPETEADTHYIQPLAA